MRFISDLLLYVSDCEHAVMLHYPVEVFSVPLPRLCKFKHLAVQIVFTNVCDRMDHSKELERGAVTGCRCFKKSLCESSSLVDIPQSALSGVILLQNRSF